MKGIYKITNPIGETYIGKSNDVEKRIVVYKRGKCKHQPLIYRSLLKYGAINHTIEIVEEYLGEDEKELSLLEIKWYCLLMPELNSMKPTLQKTNKRVVSVKYLNKLFTRQTKWLLIKDELTSTYYNDLQLFYKLIEMFIKMKLVVIEIIDNQLIILGAHNYGFELDLGKAGKNEKQTRNKGNGIRASK